MNKSYTKYHKKYYHNHREQLLEYHKKRYRICQDILSQHKAEISQKLHQEKYDNKNIIIEKNNNIVGENPK